jgi:hypothetical protein
MVSGLTGAGLVLRDNGGDDLAVSANGAFTFATKVANGAAYAVTVNTQPTGPAQTCLVSSGSGTMGSSNITTVAVACTTNYSLATVSGAYFGVGYQGSSDTGSAGTVTYDGSGNFNVTAVAANVAGTIFAVPPYAGTYAVGVDGTLTGINSGSNFDGGISADGHTLASADVTMGEQPSFFVNIQQGQSNFTAASISGSYWAVFYDSAGTNGGVGTITFDGAGNWSGTATRNNAGMVTTGVPESGTYTVNASGAMTFTPGGGAPVLNGGVSADANTLVFSQIAVNGPRPTTEIFIKQGPSTFSMASFKGTYKSISYDASSNKVDLLTLVADGAGHVTGTQVDNTAGTVTSTPITTTYTVAADGTVTVANGASPALLLYLRADGSTFVLTDTTSGDAPSIGIGIRQ